MGWSVFGPMRQRTGHGVLGPVAMPGRFEQVEVAPPPRQRACSDPEVDAVMKDRRINVLGRMIINSDPAQRIDAGRFSQEDVIEAAYQVAAFWMKTRRSDGAEMLIQTYGLEKSRVVEMASAKSGISGPKEEWGI